MLKRMFPLAQKQTLKNGPSLGWPDVWQVKFWFLEPDNKAAVHYLAVDALNNERTLNYYKKNGFSFLFKDDEQEAVNSKLKLPLKTRYMYFDWIDIIRK